MPDPHQIHGREPASRLKSGRASLARHWWPVADWLGSRKPLDLILGAMVIVLATSWLARLA